MATKKKPLWTAAKVQEQALSLSEMLKKEFGINVRGPFDIGIDSIQHEPEAQVRNGGGVMHDLGLVEQYVTHIKGGTVLPPIIINDRQQMLDGNTRRKSAEKVGQDIVPVIEAETGGNHILDRLIGGWANQRGGKRLTDRESAKLARDLATEGKPATEIARTLGFSPNKVTQIVKVVEVEKRAERLGLPINGTPEGVKVQLHKLPLDVAFTEALRLSQDARLKGKPLTALVQSLLKVGTEDESRQIVQVARTEYHEQIEKVKAGLLDPKPSPWQIITMHCGALRKVDVEKLPTIEDEARRAATRQSVAEALNVISAAYEVLV
jgi:ParB-like chromosome segregation protein Spo0J